MTPAPSSTSSLALLHLCDSLFPLGSFAHSDGLEAATAAGTVASVADLQLWLEASLTETLGRLEGPAVRQTWRLLADGAHAERSLRDVLHQLDDELHALRPSSAARQASRAMGSRLLKTWDHVHPGQLPGEWRGARLTLPIAFGVVCHSAGIGEASAIESFFYTRLAATVSSAMRLMAIGQHEAHRLLAEALQHVPALVNRLTARAEPPMCFAPLMDISAMSQQYVASRLFRS